MVNSFVKHLLCSTDDFLLRIPWHLPPLHLIRRPWKMLLQCRRDGMQCLFLGLPSVVSRTVSGNSPNESIAVFHGDLFMGVSAYGTY